MSTPEKNVLLAYSGGLDTSYLVAWLTREHGYAVTTLFVDCGGTDDAGRAELEARARTFGAVEHLCIDARSVMFERVLRWLIAGNVRRGGTYPLCVASERGLQAELLAQTAQERHIPTVAHGCTGAGNDQVRFEAALSIVADDLEVLAPVRDGNVQRDDERAYLESHDLPLPPAGGLYSVNAGLWGVTIGGGAMHTSHEPLPDDAWLWTAGGKGEARMTIGFEKGVPTELDGVACDAVTLIETLNRVAGALGVGRGYHLGDTILGFKGRIGYEAPAAEVLLAAHRELEKLVLVEDQRFYKDQLGDVYGRRLHQGLLHDPFLRDIEAFFASTQERVTGEAFCRLIDGRVIVEGVQSPHSMLSASGTAYGERLAAGASPQAALGLARALAEPARLVARSSGLAEPVA